MAFAKLASTPAKIRTANPAVVDGSGSGIDTTGAAVIIVMASRFSAAPLLAELTDSAGNTWNRRTPQFSASSNGGVIFDCINPTTSVNHTFTLTKTGDYPDIIVLAFSASGTVTFDSESGAVNGSDSYTLKPGALTLATSGLAVTGIGGYFVPSPNPPTLDVGTTGAAYFTDNLAIGQNVMTAIGYNIGSGSFDPTWTFGSGGTFTKMGAVMAAYKETASGSSATIAGSATVAFVGATVIASALTVVGAGTVAFTSQNLNTSVLTVNAAATVAFTGQVASGTISLTSPVSLNPGSVFQRNGSNQADIPIVVNITGYSSGLGSVEASFNGGAYKTIVVSPANGSNSGTLTAQASGQGSITVRFTGNHSINATSGALITIGIVGLGTGDSRMAGSSTNGQKYISASFTALRWNGSGSTAGTAWADANSESHEQTGGAGTFVPLMATQIMLDQSVPFCWINAGEGGTDMLGNTSWDPAGSATAWNNCLAQVTAASINGCEFNFGLFGPNAVASGGFSTLGDVETAYTTFKNNIAANIPGAPPTYLDLMGPYDTQSSTVRTRQDLVRPGIKALWDSGVIKGGPCLANGNYSLHFDTDAETAHVANQYWLALKRTLYSGTNKRGPRPVQVTIDGTKTIFTITYDQTLGNAALATLTASAFRTKDSGTPTAAASATVDATQTKVIVTAAAPIVGAPSLDFGSDDDSDFSNCSDAIPISQTYTLPDGTTTQYIMAEVLIDQAIITASVFSSIGGATVTNTGISLNPSVMTIAAKATVSNSTGTLSNSLLTINGSGLLSIRDTAPDLTGGGTLLLSSEGF